MLRIFAIALVLANLVLLGGRLLQADETPRKASPQASPERQDVPRLRLLSEMGDKGENDLRNAECFAAGPFETEQEKNAARRLIARSAIAISERQTVAIVDRGTWVYLPVQPDYVTARNMALTLEDAGFADAVVMQEGEWRNSVSLGYFLNEDNAQSLYRDVRSMGFPVETRKQQSQEPRYWIDYEQRAGAPYVEVTADGPVTPEVHRHIPCADQR